MASGRLAIRPSSNTTARASTSTWPPTMAATRASNSRPKIARSSSSKPCNTIIATSACCSWRITPRVIRDAERNLAVFDFVGKHAESEELAWSLQQFRPQLLMVLTRARAAQALEADDYAMAVRQVEEGLETHPRLSTASTRSLRRLSRAAKCSRWRTGSRKSAPGARCRPGNDWSGPCATRSTPRTTSARRRCATRCGTSSPPNSSTHLRPISAGNPVEQSNKSARRSPRHTSTTARSTGRSSCGARTAAAAPAEA